MKTTQRIFRNTMSLFTSGLISPLIATVVVVYLARVLGPEDFGAINFAIALITYFTLFTDMGLSLYGAREVARDKSNIREYLGSVLGLKILLTVISFSILLGFVALLNKPSEIKLLIVLFGLGLFPTVFLIEWAYQGIEKMQYIGISRILTRVVYMVLVVCFVRHHDQIYLVPCFQVASALVVNAVFFAIFSKKYGAPKLKLNILKCKPMLMAALPIGISVILIQVIYNIDTVMLGFFKGEKDVGYYNAAYKLIFPFVLGIGAYFDAIYPVASNYFTTSLEKLKIIKEHSARLMVTIALPCAVAGLIVAGPVINLFFGQQYEQSVIVFKILICMVAIICINTIYARGLWCCNKQGAYLKIVIGQAATNVILNLILIPKYGIVGAAIGKISAEAVGLVFYFCEFNKIVHVRFQDYLFRPAFSALLMGLYLALASGVNVIFLIAGGAIVYVFALFLTKGITKDDVLMFKKAIVVRKQIKQDY